MSQSQSAVPQGVADPPLNEDCEVAPKSNGVHDGVKANLESRPNATTDHQSLNASKSETTAAENDEPSFFRRQPPFRKEEAVEKADADASLTPLESTTTRDTVNEGQVLESVSPTTSHAPPPKHKPPPVGLPIDTGPPVTSYIPPSRQRPQTSLPKPHTTNDATAALSSRGGSMFRLSTPAHRKRNMANTNALTNYEADLTSRDRAKEKEAVRRFLDDKIDDEWEWEWPRSSNAPGHEFVDHLKKTGREAMKWKERDEWLSNTNDTDDDPAMPTTASPDTVSPIGSFKFESPDDVGDTIKRRELERKRRRERKLKDELAYNEGLQCFTARRDAWTGARHVNRELTRTSSRTLSSVIANLDAPSPSDETPDDNDSSDTELDQAIEIPVAPPLIPSTNGMRAGITPAAYNVIYDKVVLQSISPSCPVNLQDIISACVQGWKRDGEWPPKGTTVEAPTAAAKRKGRKLSVASIFGLSRIAKEIAEDEKEKDGQVNESGIRRGLQKMLGLRRESNATNGNGNVHVVKGKEADVTAAA